MEIINNPLPETWSALCQRPVAEQQGLNTLVRDILLSVKQEGDRALLRFTQQFDRIALKDLAVSPQEIAAAAGKVDNDLKQAIALARQNIQAFHASQAISSRPVITSPGVACWQQSVGIEKVGLYIPGGSAPLFSTILMLGVPAQLAGCQEIVLCSPADENGRLDPVVLYTAGLLGITSIFKVGGAQAIAAMAYGTATIPRVYKIFGPGNQFVTRAKELVQLDGLAIDMPAGPSEVLIIADDTGNPDFIAADLLAQAEHGPDSQVMLLSTSSRLLSATVAALNRQLPRLPRQEIAQKALANSRFILLASLDECLAFSNLYAPEHLIVATEKAASLARGITNAGSVFLGNFSCESAGDYASGTNHTLPTNGFARSYSGVSLDSFVRKITFQELSQEGLATIGPAIACMAEAEGLWAHKNAVNIRLKPDNNV